MAFMCICFNGEVCICHAAFSHFAHRQTHDSWVKYLYVPICHDQSYYIPVFQLYVLLCVNPSVPICYSMLPLSTCMSLVCHLCGVSVKDPFSFVKKIYTKS